MIVASRRALRRARRVKAGQRRALRYFSARLVHWRCPSCVTDVRRPPTTPEGISCPLCGELDRRSSIKFWKQTIPGGFRWIVTMEEPHA